MCVRENDATTPNNECFDTRLAGPSRLEQDDPDAFALQQMEEEEEARLAEEAQGFTCLVEELEHDENTEWLRGCAWPRWFAHKPLHLITATATTPSRREQDLDLGWWNSVEWISDATMEANLRRLLEITSRVLARCEETLLQTPRVFCCWLRSWGLSFYPYPFELPQRSSTKQKYYLYFNRFLCYVFRSWRLCLQLGQNMEGIYGLRLTRDQLFVMEAVWKAIAKLQAERTDLIPASLLELVFQLLVLFWTDVATDGVLETKAVVHFSGVLGIHPNELAFRTAYDYTPYLSAMIWVGRLVVLEYVLPLRPYQSLETKWPERAAYTNQVERFCGQIRPKFLQRGSVSPIGYLIERLQHGRAIAKREGPRTNISWSPDGQTLEIEGGQISLQQFRQTIHHLEADLEQTARALMLQWWPKVVLRDIKDDLSTHRPGYSFLSHPLNRMEGSCKHLSRRAFSRELGFALQGPGREKALNYLKSCDRLVMLLFSGIHLTSGMPARGEELRVVRWADSAAVPRNIFVYNGRVMLVFSYNKAGLKSNNSFYIVRFPAPSVQHVLFLYLAYIRPFSDFLARQLKIAASKATNPHLFTTYRSLATCFRAETCVKSLQLSTPSCPIKLNMKLYRQIAIRFAKRHISALLQPFDPNTPNDYDGFLRLLSFQTGHNPSTHVGAYALYKAYPAKLQSELIERYLQNSIVWHELIADKGTIQADKILNDGPSDGNSSEFCTQHSGVSTPPVLVSTMALNTTTLDRVVFAGSGMHHVELKRASQEDDRSHSLLKRIKIMKAGLERLEDEYNRTKR
jgi:hypothetical protein